MWAELFVGKLLKIWELEASAIPVGEFIGRYKKLGVPDPATPPGPLSVA